MNDILYHAPDKAGMGLAIYTSRGCPISVRYDASTEKEDGFVIINNCDFYKYPFAIAHAKRQILKNESGKVVYDKVEVDNSTDLILTVGYCIVEFNYEYDTFCLKATCGECTAAKRIAMAHILGRKLEELKCTPSEVDHFFAIEILNKFDNSIK